MTGKETILASKQGRRTSFFCCPKFHNVYNHKAVIFAGNGIPPAEVAAFFVSIKIFFTKNRKAAAKGSGKEVQS